MQLIDTHQHLIYRHRFSYSWTDDIPPLAKGDFTPSDYWNKAGDAVAGTIFMETAVDDGEFQSEALYASELKKQKDSNILGVIASCRPEVDNEFERWLDTCTTLGVVGYRRILHTQPDNLSQSKTFRSNIRKIGVRNQVFDMCFLTNQLPIAVELADSCPDTTLILNHCGVPDIANNNFEPWHLYISELAKRQNVVCKLSGLTAYCAENDRSLEAITPYVDHVLESFGPNRMVWGSDWPVVNLGSGLPDWIELTQKILSKLTTDEAQAIAQGTAKRVYGVHI